MVTKIGRVMPLDITVPQGLKINFLITQPKHMLWVLKGTLSKRWFFLAPKNTCLTEVLSKYRVNSVLFV